MPGALREAWMEGYSDHRAGRANHYGAQVRVRSASGLALRIRLQPRLGTGPYSRKAIAAPTLRRRMPLNLLRQVTEPSGAIGGRCATEWRQQVSLC